MKKHKYLYIYTDGTKYELPLAVCDTAKELAEKIGTSENTIVSSLYHARKQKNINSRYKRVERGEDDD